MIGHRGTTGGPLPKRPVECANNSETRGCSPGSQETTTTLALFEHQRACGLRLATQSFSLPADPIQTTPVGTGPLSPRAHWIPPPCRACGAFEARDGASWHDLGPGRFGSGRVVRLPTGVRWVLALRGPLPNGSETVRREATGRPRWPRWLGLMRRLCAGAAGLELRWDRMPGPTTGGHTILHHLPL